MTETFRVLDSVPALQQSLDEARSRGLRIGLVPTMGNLHEGHLTLVRSARQHCDLLLATIFVNPAQFGPNEDFDKYPRTFDADLAALSSVDCDAVFVPSVSDIYPNGPQRHTRISVPGLSGLLCGASRPGHFDGVCTVVYKLFTLIRPDLAIFGLKDYQQFRIISRMTADLLLPVELMGIPVVREASGLALSSRNSYLSTLEKQQATAIHAILQATALKIRNAENDFRSLETQAIRELQDSGLKPDYFAICNADSLLPAEAGESQVVILCAAYAGSTRLIDNIRV